MPSVDPLRVVRSETPWFVLPSDSASLSLLHAGEISAWIAEETCVTAPPGSSSDISRSAASARVVSGGQNGEHERPAAWGKFNVYWALSKSASASRTCAHNANCRLHDDEPRFWNERSDNAVCKSTHRQRNGSRIPECHATESQYGDPSGTRSVWCTEVCQVCEARLAATQGSGIWLICTRQTTDVSAIRSGMPMSLTPLLRCNRVCRSSRRQQRLCLR